MMYPGWCAISYTYVILLMLFQSSDAVSARFTKHPDDTLYVREGRAATFAWDYFVNDRDREFDSLSPIWYFHNSSFVIGFCNGFIGWKFMVAKSSCPSRLQNKVWLEGNATLVITNVTLADSGTYGCGLRLTIGPILTSLAQLIVTETPRFTSIPHSKEIAFEYSDLSFTCTAVGTPTPNVTWMQVSDSTSLSKGLGSVVLLIRNINRRQSGAYECQAVNNPNEIPVIATSIVTVYYKPTIRRDSSTNNITSWAGNTITLRCKWSSSRPNPTWKWYKPNGDRIIKVVTIPNGSEVRVLTGQENDDYGMYRCKATNIAGIDWHNISVTRLFSPGPPVIDVVGIQPSSVMIIWTRSLSNGGTPVNSYKLLINSKTWYVNSSKILGYQKITGLQEQTEYKITVLAGNIAGYGDTSVKVFNTTKHETKSKPSPVSTQDNCSTKVGVLAALALSLITIVIHLAFMILKHRRTTSQNSKLQEQKEVVYENSDAIGMGHLASSSSPSLTTNQKSNKTALPTDARSPNQEHYQQLNPRTLQSSTATAPTYEPLRKNDAVVATRKGQHTH